MKGVRKNADELKIMLIFSKRSIDENYRNHFGNGETYTRNVQLKTSGWITMFIETISRMNAHILCVRTVWVRKGDYIFFCFAEISNPVYSRVYLYFSVLIRKWIEKQTNEPYKKRLVGFKQLAVLFQQKIALHLNSLPFFQQMDNAKITFSVIVSALFDKCVD